MTKKKVVKKSLSKVKNTIPAPKMKHPKKSIPNVKFQAEIEVDPVQVIYRLMDVLSPTQILSQLMINLYMESGHKMDTALGLLAEKKDAENVEIMMLITYALNKKDELKDEIFRHWQLKQELMLKRIRP